MAFRYVESVSILYSQNTFDTSNPDVIAYLPSLLLPQRLHAIRSLRFYWSLTRAPTTAKDQGERSFRYNDDVWQNIWRNLASMRGLSDLVVGIHIPFIWQTQWTQREVAILAPVKAVTRPACFEMILNFPSNAEEQLLDLPCHVIRVGQARASAAGS